MHNNKLTQVKLIISLAIELDLEVQDLVRQKQLEEMDKAASKDH